eukprot:m.193033 g.193033  ORF g.193033 m.193033 type:complete len:282 (-) comp16972_c0_seq2:3867-4712(-)
MALAVMKCCQGKSMIGLSILILLLVGLAIFDFSNVPMFKANDGSCPHSLRAWAESLHEWEKAGTSTRGSIRGHNSTLFSPHRIGNCQATLLRPLRPTRPLGQRSQFCLTNFDHFLHARRSLIAAGVTLHLGTLCLAAHRFLIPSKFSSISRHKLKFYAQVAGCWTVAGCFIAAIALLLALPKQAREFERSVPSGAVTNNNESIVCDNRQYHVADQVHLYVGIAVLVMPAAIVTTIWALFMTCMLATPDPPTAPKPREGLAAPLLGVSASSSSDDAFELADM